jgi:hypothetical protein
MDTLVFIPTDTLTPTLDVVKTATNTDIPTDIPTVTPTITLEPTPTIIPLAYGKLLATYFTPYDEPDNNMLTTMLRRNQFLVILSTKESHGALWYECVWEIEGISGRGWILAKNIKIVEQAPTLTP